MIRKTIYLRYVLGYFSAVILLSGGTIWLAKHLMPHIIYLFWLWAGGPVMIYGASKSVKLTLEKHDPEWGRPVARMFTVSLIMYGVIAFAEAQLPNTVTAWQGFQEHKDIQLAQALNPRDPDSLADGFCVVTPEGLQWFSTHIKDPTYGIQSERCTLEQIAQLRRANHPNLDPERVQVDDARTFKFFELGKPIFYDKSPSGEYEFFDRSGRNPSTGAVLQQVDQPVREDAIRLQDERKAAAQQAEQQQIDRDRLAVVTKARQQAAEAQRSSELQRAANIQADKERRASYLISRSPTNKVEYIVAAETSARSPMNSFAAAIVKDIRSKGRTSTSVVFSPSFVASGTFDVFFDGRGGADIQNMPISAIGNKILLARISTRYVRPGTTAYGLISASMAGSVRIISARDGGFEDGFELEAVGAGTSDDDARSAALDSMLRQLSQHSY